MSGDGGNLRWRQFNVENHDCPAGGKHVRVNAEIRTKCAGCGEWFADLHDVILGRIKPVERVRGPKPQESLTGHALRAGTRGKRAKAS